MEAHGNARKGTAESTWRDTQHHPLPRETGPQTGPRATPSLNPRPRHYESEPARGKSGAALRHRRRSAARCVALDSSRRDPTCCRKIWQRRTDHSAAGRTCSKRACLASLQSAMCAVAMSSALRRRSEKDRSRSHSFTRRCVSRPAGSGSCPEFAVAGRPKTG
jgi:hypothetical protein